MSYSKQFKLLTLLCLLVLTLTGCGGGNSGTDNSKETEKKTTVTPLKDRKAPVVNAGEDLTIKEKYKVTLSSVATDSDGSIVSYLWQQISGPKVQLNSTDKAELTFTAPEIIESKTLVLKVSVTDDDGLTASDEITVNLIELIAPTVDASEDHTAKETATVTLTSEATDSDGSIVSYKWRQISGQSVEIKDNDKAKATFPAPSISSIPETLEFKILVTDSDGLTASDKVTVTVDSVPVFTNVNAIAGDNQITLSWELNDDKQLDYIRYFNIENGEQRNINTIYDINKNEHSISGLTNGLPYYFQLTISKPEIVRHVIEGIPKSPSTGLLNDTGLFYDTEYTNAIEEQVPFSLRPEFCADISGFGQQDCSHGRNAQLLANNLSRSGINKNFNGFDFNILDATGNIHDDPEKPWTCVRDNHTGLVWEVKTDDGGIHDKGHKYRWGGKTAKGDDFGEYYPDWNVLVNGSNTSNFCGYNDWRVPTLKELHSVIDYSRKMPTLDTIFFPNSTTWLYWTSSPVAESNEQAWAIFLLQPVKTPRTRTDELYVRLVRGGRH